MSIQGRQDKKRQVRSAIKESGKSFVKAKHIDDKLDMPKDEIGKGMALLEEDGELEKWNKGAASYGSVYKVLL